jgi:hypothetical protein
LSCIRVRVDCWTATAFLLNSLVAYLPLILIIIIVIISLFSSLSARAAKVFEKNCLDKKYSPSCYNLGRLYYAGKGVATDDVKVRIRVRVRGRLYYAGKGVPTDDIKVRVRVRVKVRDV